MKTLARWSSRHATKRRTEQSLTQNPPSGGFPTLLPREVSKGLVRLGHTVHLVLFLDSVAFIL